VYVRKRSRTSTESFTQTAELMLDLVEQGNTAAATKYLPDLKAIQATLSLAAQEQTQETVVVLETAIRISEFHLAQDALTASFTLNDAVATRAAYERVLSAYNAIPQTSQEQFANLIAQAHNALDSYLQRQETSAQESVSQ
jgi:hypothetical protein